MVFSSGVFLFLFLPGLLILYYLFAKTRPARNYILLVTSLMFYAWGEPVFVFIMIASIFMNWYVSLHMSRSAHKKLWLTLAIGLDVLLLGVFKYAGFVSENLALLTGNTALRVRIALPIGISFFTFQMMSYVFDVYYGKSEAQRNPLYVALYISFFPQLIAGPIVRYNQIEAEIESRSENWENFSEGVRRFIYGLGKKVLLANFLGQIADNVFGYIVNPSVMLAWLGAIAYTFQIYFDFSGYGDMAIGLGLMFGFHFEENFRYPYLASSIGDFWRRWHISLSTWFRDYVYIPLGGSRVNSKSRLVFNLFVTWTLTGIWHGANWTFLVWGLLYFVLLTVEKLTGLHKKAGFFGHIYTMLFVVLGWVLFRAESISAAADYIASMFGAGAQLYDSYMLTYLSSYKVYFIAGIIACFPIYRLFKDKINSKVYNCISAAIIFALFILSLSFMVKGAYNPFIYFNF